MAGRINIAIDGPAASGKSTTARLVARALDYIYIDTGAMYRAITLAVIRAGIEPADRMAVEKTALASIISLKLIHGTQHTFLNGEDVSEDIRKPEINNIISIIAAYAGVRRQMVLQQQEMARPGGVVMDGRDIGTIVLPKAELKIFMLAGVEERARRRQAELQARGVEMDFSLVVAEIENRDRIDSSRDVAPLKPAPDARLLDTTKLSIEDQVRQIIHWAEAIIG